MFVATKTPRHKVSQNYSFDIDVPIILNLLINKFNHTFYPAIDSSFFESGSYLIAFLSVFVS